MNENSQEVVIYHNPRCSKSRHCLALLQEAGIAPEIRLYLEDAPDQEELRSVLAKLGLVIFCAKARRPTRLTLKM